MFDEKPTSCSGLGAKLSSACCGAFYSKAGREGVSKCVPLCIQHGVSNISYCMNRSRLCKSSTLNLLVPLLVAQSWHSWIGEKSSCLLPRKRQSALQLYLFFGLVQKASPACIVTKISSGEFKVGTFRIRKSFRLISVSL